MKMDTENESFTISSQEPFLAANNQQQSSPLKTTTMSTNKNLKTILIALLVLFLLIVISSMMILYSIDSRSKKPNSYESGSSRYYCHLTRYQRICYHSMSSVINTTVLKSGPGPIFSASLRAAFNQLDTVSVSIAKSTSNDSLVGARMSDCRAWVHDSKRRLNESLALLGVDPDVEALTSLEMDNVRAWSSAAKANAYKCYSGLQEIKDVVEENNGVEEVKMGVEKVRKCMVNSIRLWDMRGAILDDFYNPYTLVADYDYYDSYYYYYNFDYGFMICLYSGLYIFMALLYFLFWRN